MNVDRLRCIHYARICTIDVCHLYHYIQTGRPPVLISSELKLKQTLDWPSIYPTFF